MGRMQPDGMARGLWGRIVDLLLLRALQLRAINSCSLLTALSGRTITLKRVI